MDKVHFTRDWQWEGGKCGRGRRPAFVLHFPGRGGRGCLLDTQNFEHFDEDMNMASPGGAGERGGAGSCRFWGVVSYK